ncbi:hypothetical protein TYRP_003934 [Tyrophagus putrescentiae]|nr:hypothetical protein TYRP_003934 [Tyrophagus putrescentiae]
MTFWTPSLFLAPIGWHPRPHSGLKIITIITSTTRAPVSMLPFFSEPQDRRRPGWMAIRMDYDEDGRLQGWMATRMDDRDGRLRKLKTEDRKPKTEDRRRGEEAGNRTVALPKRQSTLAVDLLKRYCPPSDVGRTEEDSDKDGPLSEDGEADG